MTRWVTVTGTFYSVYYCMTLTTADSTSNSRISIATATEESWTNGCIARLQAKEEAYMSA